MRTPSPPIVRTCRCVRAGRNPCTIHTSELNCGHAAHIVRVTSNTVSSLSAWMTHPRTTRFCKQVRYDASYSVLIFSFTSIIEGACVGAHCFWCAGPILSGSIILGCATGHNCNSNRSCLTTRGRWRSGVTSPGSCSAACSSHPPWLHLYMSACSSP
jgi:hypothetical protein